MIDKEVLYVYILYIKIAFVCRYASKGFTYAYV